MSVHTIRQWSTDIRKQFRYAHIKRDGHYLALQNTADGVRALSSQGTDLTAKLQLHDCIRRAAKLPVGCTVAGELWQPGKPASAVKTAIAANDNLLQFSAFALLRYVTLDGNDYLTPDQCAALPLPDVERICTLYGFDFVPFRVIRPTATNTILADLCNEDCKRDKDCEGWVFKNANLLDWHKLKPEKRIDLIVTSTTDGMGKYTGQIGAIECSTIEGYPVALVSGMKDTEREMFTEWISKPCTNGKLIGRIVEIEYQRVDSRGRLRHPRFIRLRDIDDKDISRCDVSQDDDLKAYWKSTLFV